MTSDAAAIDAQRKAIEARRLFEDKAFQEAMSRLERDYIERWKNSATAEERELLWHRLRALEDIRTDLTATISGGAVAAHNARLRRKP